MMPVTTGMAARIALATWRPRLSMADDPCSCASRVLAQTLRLLLPSARGGLLPIGQRVAGCLVGLPALAAVDHCGVVAAVKQLEAALVVGQPVRAGAIGDEQEGGAVGVLVEMGEPHGLAVGLAV